MRANTHWMCFATTLPTGSKFAVVEQSGDLSRHSEGSKVASKAIAIKAEIDIPFLVKASIEYTTSRCTPIDPASPASATGYRGAAMASGREGKAKGIEGNAIFLVYRDPDNYKIVHAKGGVVGQNGIKSDVFYTLSSAGEFIEVAE